MAMLGPRSGLDQDVCNGLIAVSCGFPLSTYQKLAAVLFPVRCLCTTFSCVAENAGLVENHPASAQ